MVATRELTHEKFKKRMKQAEEMERIWEENNKIAQAYLKGCISTAMAIVSGGIVSGSERESAEAKL